MATAATKRNTSLVKNPARQVTLKGNTAKRTNALTRNRSKKRAVVAKKQVRSKRRYRRNPAMGGALDGLLPALIGAVGINLFDLGVNTVAPNLSATIRTGAKFFAGFAFKAWGRRIPVIGAYSGTIGNALYLAAGLDIVATYVMPSIAGLIATAKTQVSGLLGNGAVQTGTATDGQGNIGAMYQLPNGQRVEVFRRQPQRQRIAF